MIVWENTSVIIIKLYFKHVIMYFFVIFKGRKFRCLQFSFQTIFYILPRLSGLVEDEWIAIGKFTRFTDIPLDARFQWYLSPAQLCELKPGDWSQQDIGKKNLFYLFSLLPWSGSLIHVT